MRKPEELKQIGMRITLTQKVLLPLLAVLVVIGLLEGVSHLLLWALGPSETSGVRFMASDVLKHEEHPYHKRDQELFWKPNPNYSEINQRGFRGPEF